MRCSCYAQNAIILTTKRLDKHFMYNHQLVCYLCIITSVHVCCRELLVVKKYHTSNNAHDCWQMARMRWTRQRHSESVETCLVQVPWTRLPPLLLLPSRTSKRNVRFSSRIGSTSTTSPHKTNINGFQANYIETTMLDLTKRLAPNFLHTICIDINAYFCRTFDDNFIFNLVFNTF